MRKDRFKIWILLVFASLGAPAAYAAPCAGFVDVQDSDDFCAEITWLRNRAITLGCTANQYCPAQFVRRDQMAAFLYRLGVENAFLHGGNAFGTTAILGTTDNRALQLNVNGARALTLAPATGYFGSIPNLVGGHPENRVAVNCPGICLPTPEPPAGAVVAGGGIAGQANRVTDSFGVISGGQYNRAGNDDVDHRNATGATVAGGAFNTASGMYSMVAGGSVNEASGFHSFAAGRQAKAQHHGCFVWGDAEAYDVACGTSNEFVARANGGVRFITDIDGNGAPVWACVTTAGNGWACSSDRNQKQKLRQLDGRAVLEGLLAMPVFEWYPKGRNANVKHYGPMAQDFRAAFGLGDDDTMIGSQDADGVALAAIQGLNRKLEQKVATLEAALHDLAEEIRTLKNARRD